MAGVTFIAIGLIHGFLTKIGPLKTAFGLLLTGGLATLVAYFVGHILAQSIGCLRQHDRAVLVVRQRRLQSCRRHSALSSDCNWLRGGCATRSGSYRV